MARRQKLKVFRTPTGFHDAYVAAPSRKAALEAWGSDVDLFARGVAELVVDDELAREPLANPGKVIRKSRGTPEEQLAALLPDSPKRRVAGGKDGPPESKRKALTRDKPSEREAQAAPRATARPKPKPSRQKLEELERALTDLAERQRAEESAVRDRQKTLERERRNLETVHACETEKAELALEKERKAHSERLERWIEKQGVVRRRVR